ncbi:MAG TPA: fibronectin type III domain-containing protein [Candidatus Woesebacteria bacterium]|nr:fibronectin type III domain-containing protein [Candidatus Woesebacteria bacterium]
MKGKVNLKTIIILAILVLVIILSVLVVNTAKTFISGAAADYEPQNLMAVPKEDGKTAVVSWTTDKEVRASIFYGTNMASLLLMAEDIEATIDHNILLTNLKSDTTYYYKIVIDNDNIFDNGGLMYNFKTNASLEPVVTIQPTLIPTIAASSSGSSACDRTTDYNKDGTVNSIDYISCTKGAITPGVSDVCAGDYNKDGVTNSLDRIKCLQETKR